MMAGALFSCLLRHFFIGCGPHRMPKRGNPDETILSVNKQQYLLVEAIGLHKSLDHFPLSLIEPLH